MREREASLTFIKERQNREDKERKLDEKREERERKKEERDGRKEKEKSSTYVSSDHFEEQKEKECIYQRVRVSLNKMEIA